MGKRHKAPSTVEAEPSVESENSPSAKNSASSSTDASLFDSHLTGPSLRPAPVDSANLLSIYFWWWAGALLRRGYKSSLAVEDLWSVPKAGLVSSNVDKLENFWKEELASKKHPTLWKPLFKLAGPRFIFFVGLLYALWATMTFLNVGYVLPTLITWLRENAISPKPIVPVTPSNVTAPLSNTTAPFAVPASSPLPSWSGWILAAAMFVVAGVQQMFIHHYFFIATESGLQVTGAVKAFIYRKALRLSSVTTSVGEIVNLQSNDVSRIYDAMRYGHTLWLTPFVIVGMFLLVAVLSEAELTSVFIVNAGLLIQQVGWVPAIVGSVTCLLVVPIQSVIGKLIGKVKRTTLPITDERVRLMHEILSAIKLVKLYNWEQPFMSQTEQTREREMKGLRKVSIAKGFNNVWAQWSAPLVAFVTFAICASMDPASGYSKAFTPTSAFTALALFNILRFPMAVFPSAVKAVAEARVAVRRLTNFLLMDEIEDKRELLPLELNSKYPIVFKKASFQYNVASSNRGLNDKPSKETSKKTVAPFSNEEEKLQDESRFTLRKLSLKIKRGELIAVVGRVGSGKSTFLLSLAGEMRQVSGSLKVAGSVAYVSQQAWLLNDSLKQNVIFGQAPDEIRFRRALESCELLPDLDQLPAREHTEIGERGINLSGGQKARVSLARAVFSNRDVYLLDDPLSAVDQHVGNKLFQNCIRGILKDKTVIFVTNQLQYLRQCDRIVVLESGRIAELGTYDELLNSGGDFAQMIRDHVATDDNDEYSTDEDTTNNISPEHKSSKEAPESSQNDSGHPAQATSAGKLITAEDRATGNVGATVYARYFKSGGWALGIWVIFLSLFQQAVRVMSDWWIQYWSKDTVGTSPSTFYIWVYAVFLGGYGAALIVRCVSYAFWTMRASTNLHNGVFSRVLRAPMSFFDSTPLGRILNRFTKDQDSIDDTLPDAFEQGFQSILTVLSSVILIISVLWWFALALIPMGLAFWFMGAYYRQTSREIKRLDGITRSPIFAHLSASLSGLSTIRAYGVSPIFEEQNRQKIDVNNSTQYYFEVAARWLAVRLDFLSMIIVSGTAFLAVAMKDVVPAPLSALALSYALQTTGMLQWGVRMLAETENQMTSVERLLHYTLNLEQEAPGVIPDLRPPASWPASPSIRFKQVELKYKPDLPPALKKVSFKIKAKEKIGIVGRTGAGKSTLATSLFRILEPSSGSIIIDGVDVLKIGLDDLRSALAIIPQDPVLFKNTVRYNLDPFGVQTDVKLWETLEKVFLKDVIAGLPNQLSAMVHENGSNFSAGQRQLICFGRAVLRGSKILVLDEATASIDLETDQRIQRTIRETFKDCTVLTVAHRLHTIIDSDRIMVLSMGSVVEFDSPARLLKDPQSELSKLVDETGTETANYLRDIAFGHTSMFAKVSEQPSPRTTSSTSKKQN